MTMTTTTATTTPAPASGPPTVVPALYRRRQFAVLVAAIVAIGVLAPALTDSHRTKYAVDLWLAYSIAAVGFYLMFALAGRFAFCQTLMMALGGYTCAWVTAKYGPGSFLVGALAGMAVTALLAVGVGWCARRVEGFMFAIITLAVEETGRTVFRETESFTGLNGTRVGVAAPELFGHRFLGDESVFYLLLGALALTLLIALAIERSPVRRDALAASTNAMVARSVGVPLTATQIGLFALGSALGGLAGALFASWNGSISADSFGLEIAVGLLLMVVLGGVGSPWGAVLGAGLYVALPEVLTSLERYRSVLFGVILLVVVIAAPTGLLGLAAQLRARIARVFRRVRPSRRSPGVAGGIDGGIGGGTDGDLDVV